MVLRQGQMQQAGPPRELYDHPVNLFVAGFIGSPAMNFLPGELAGQLAGGSLRCPLGDVPLSAGTMRRLAEENAPQDVIVGIRPEDFEDAALIDDAKRGRGGTIRVRPDVLESLGSDVFAYFPVPQRPGAEADELRLTAAEAGRGDVPAQGTFVARLDPATRACEGVPLSLWLDTSKLRLFDARTGRALGRGRPAR